MILSKKTIVTVSAILVVVCLGAGTAVALHGSNTSQQLTPATSHVVHTMPVQTPQPVAAAASATPATTTTPAPSPALQSVTPTPVAKPIPAPTPVAAVQPAPQPSITISSDGCKVTGNGPAGMTFIVGAYLSGQHGGQSNYKLPASYSLAESTGGFKDQTAFGELIDASGTVLVTVTRPITATSCAAGDPSATNNTYPMPAGA